MNSHQVRERILVVDDEQVIRELLKRVLDREGYEVTTTPCSEDAVRLMSAKSFDLAIVDAGYGNPNGCKLMKKVREASPETAILVTTGYPVAEVIRFAKEHTQGYLEKPFDLQAFLAAVRSTLGKVLMQGMAPTCAGWRQGLW